MKKNSGFTLIELVVVMAILAILAAVAVPAYSGYINKANEAANQQKIEAVETAMSSALAMEGKNSSDANKYFAASFANNELTITKVTENVPSDATSVWDNFANFYAGDSTAKASYELELNTSTTPKVLNITVSSTN